MAEIEQRVMSCPSLRMEGGETPRLVGHAATFDEMSTPRQSMMWGYIEEIAPEAFDRALAEKQDVFSFWNHNRDIILGRTTAETLQLGKDPIGLTYGDSPPTTQTVRDLVLAPAARGEIRNMSFSFLVPKNRKGQSWSMRDGIPVRRLLDLDLVDAGPVALPAYAGPDVSLRSMIAERSRLDIDEMAAVFARAYAGGKLEQPHLEVLERSIAAIRGLRAEPAAPVIPNPQTQLTIDLYERQLKHWLADY